MEKMAREPQFWQDQKKAVKTRQEITVLKMQIGTFHDFKQELKDIEGLASLLQQSPKAKEAEMLLERLKEFEENLRQKTQEILLCGEYDARDAILSVQSGAGGRDADDFAAMLLKMYQRYCERRGWPFYVLSQCLSEGGGPEGRIGVKETVLEIKAKFAYGILKKETGVHRLVRLSPFSAKQLRHTSFCLVEVLPKLQEVEFGQIKPEDLKFETFKATGHGGQNVNKRETAVRLTHLPTGVSVTCQEQRDQAQNRKIALSILAAKLMSLKQREKESELKEIKGKRVSIEFGHQIRSYVLHPYKLVKDHRTAVEVSDTQDVFDGGLDPFIEAEMQI